MTKFQPMVISHYEPPKKKKAIKPLNSKMAVRHRRAAPPITG